MIKATNLIQTGIAWIPEIPSDWELKRIKLLFDFNKYIVGKTSADYDVLSLTTKGVIKRDLESGMGKFPASFDGYQIVKPNSIMLCLFDMDVTPRVVGHVDDDGIISAAYTNIIPKKGINAKYYYYYFLLQDKNKSLLALGTGIRITLNKDFFGTLKIPVPPIEVQNSIVAYLDKKNNEIDKFIRNKERLIELLEEQLLYKINEALTIGLNEESEFKTTSIPNIPRIPMHWEIKKFKWLTSILSCGYASTPEYVDEEKGVAFLSAQNCRPFRMDFNKFNYISPTLHKKLTQNKKPQRGDVLVTRVGAGIGDACVVDTDLEFSVYVSLTHIRTTKEILSGYVVYFFKTQYCLQLNSEGTIEAGGQGNLNVKNVEKYRIPLPPINEQKEICTYLDIEREKINTAISKAQQEIDSIKEYREALITDLVTGKLSVPQLQMS